jgi:hypothetical protein
MIRAPVLDPKQILKQWEYFLTTYYEFMPLQRTVLLYLSLSYRQQYQHDGRAKF